MSSDYYGSIAGEIADQGAETEAAFLEWLNTYTRVEEDRGRTTWDDIRAAFMAGRANLEDVKGLLGRELQSANAVIMRQAAAGEPGEALAAVREYRIYIDEDGDGIRLIGPCAETVGCLFNRCFDAYPSMHEDIGLGHLIDAALEHERDKEQLHAAQMRSEGMAQ